MNNLASPTAENGAWSPISGTWKQLHGGFPGTGLSIEWHHFHLDSDLDWGRSFHRDSLEICLNFSGSGIFQDDGVDHAFGADQVLVYTAGQARPRAVRKANGMHRFLTLELSANFLRTQFSKELGMLKSGVRKFIETKRTVATPTFFEMGPLPASLLSTRLQFIEPPVPQAARRAYYHGRVLEIMAQTLFKSDPSKELFCEKHHRTNRERIQRVCFLIERDLENPPSLEMLAQEVGCSTFYLSRLFAKQTGMNIPKFLRKKRIDKAAALLKSGKMNVTDAAMAVGYSSLGSFTKAFVDQVGCCPGLYPIAHVPHREVPLPEMF
jgi:AraC family transcriptional regulator